MPACFDGPNRQTSGQRFRRPDANWGCSLLLWAICLFATSHRAQAHGDTHLQIADLNRQIETNANSAPLFLRRGELFRLDGNWTNALSDLERALKLDPELHLAQLERGRVYFDAGQPEKADQVLSQFRRIEPTNAVARLTRARTLLWLGQNTPAIADYNAAIQNSPNPGPDLFLERAGAYRSLKESGLEPALAGLLEGIRHHGPIVTLEMAALDLEVELKRWDAALKRLDQLSNAAPRRDRWLMRRAEILERAGRAPEALNAWKEARKEFEALPERLQQSKSGQQQAAALKEKLGASGK
jgi:tetratricopeptide (TPR) repeat protein